MSLRNSFLCPFLLLVAELACGQNKYVPALDTLARDYLQSLRNADKEIVFVHTDKSIFSAGEDIWLRAYCIGERSHRPRKQSKSIFVDVVNDHDSLVNRIILNNDLDNMDGLISLPPTLPEGMYWLRAYTRRQIRHDSLAIFVQPLYVSNPGHRVHHDTTSKDQIHDATGPVKTGEPSIEPSIRFYPEGGTIIAGSDTKMAFTAFDGHGNPLEVFGYITDNANTIVAKYGTTLPGMGSFGFFAVGKMRYVAHTVYDGSKVLTTLLPPPDPYGYQLSVTGQTNDSIYGQVSLGDSVYRKFKTSYVLAVHRDSLCYAAVGTDMFTFAIARNKFPPGKATLLLFNEAREIVSQRDLYLDQPGPAIAVSPDRSSYGKREKVWLSISTGKMGVAPAASALSIAVTNEQVADRAASPTAIGRFNQDDITFPYKQMADSASRQLSPNDWDLVMLVQPCHSLGWKNAAQLDSLSDFVERTDTDLVILSGKVLDSRSRPVRHRVVTLISNSGTNILETDTTDENGRFRIKLPDDILDSTRLNLQVSTPKGMPLYEDSISIDPGHFPGFRTPVALKNRLSASRANELKDVALHYPDTLAIGKSKEWLKPAYVSRWKRDSVSYDASKIVSQFSRIIPGDRIGLSHGDIETAIVMTPGVGYMGGHLMIHGSSGLPLLFVDGSQIFLPPPPPADPVMDYLKTLNPRTIDFIEILEGADANIYGPGSYNGVIYVHTRSGFRPDPGDEKKGLKTFYARGYFAAPPFPEPDYDKKEIRDSPYPDQRSALYWSGNLQTDDRGNAQLHFFTADDSANYKVSIIGLEPDGKIIVLNTVLKR